MTSLSGVRKRVKSPIAATIDSATVASTPGMVISRSTSEQASAALAEVPIDQGELLGVEVQLPQQRRYGGPLIGGQVLAV